MYLTEPERDQLMQRIGELSASGSQMALGAASVDGSGGSRAASVADPATWLRRWGWRPVLYEVTERFGAYRRGIPPAVEALVGATRRWLVSSELHPRT